MWFNVRLLSACIAVRNWIFGSILLKWATMVVSYRGESNSNTISVSSGILKIYQRY
jgi:hypothetical protein